MLMWIFIDRSRSTNIKDSICTEACGVVVHWRMINDMSVLLLGDCCPDKEPCPPRLHSLRHARDFPQTGQSLKSSPAALSCQPEERAYHGDCCPRLVGLVCGGTVDSALLAPVAAAITHPADLGTPGPDLMYRRELSEVASDLAHRLPEIRDLVTSHDCAQQVKLHLAGCVSPDIPGAPCPLNSNTDTHHFTEIDMSVRRDTWNDGSMFERIYASVVMNTSSINDSLLSVLVLPPLQLPLKKDHSTTDIIVRDIVHVTIMTEFNSARPSEQAGIFVNCCAHSCGRFLYADKSGSSRPPTDRCTSSG
ncbi:hypothetical protein CBL_05535 [Carabus blaptoides fortunei]